uniref:Uncharacterized protein n=1 Tax=Avena sativa TaxID=4498 RepID=A0ACD5UN58_AVESA
MLWIVDLRRRRRTDHTTLAVASHSITTKYQLPSSFSSSTSSASLPFALLQPPAKETQSSISSELLSPRPTFAMAPRVSFLLVGVVLLLGLSAGAAPASNKEGDALYELRLRLSDPNGVLQSRDPTLVNPCTWFHVTCDHASRVFRLDLGNSNVSGSIGPEVIRLVNLQYLELYRNNLYGEIPKELGKLKNLINLDLYANKLTGRIPKSLSKLSSLRFIYVLCNY